MDEQVPFRLLAVVQEADKPNANGRVYPRNVLEQQVIFFKSSKYRTLFGETGIPTDPCVKIEKASHVVKDLYMSDNNLMAEIEILDTKQGKQLRALLAAGVPIGFRMSGVGEGEDANGCFIVNESYKLSQIFACTNPA